MHCFYNKMLFNKQNGNSNSVYPLVLSWCNEVMLRNTGFGAVHAGQLGATKMSVLFYPQPPLSSAGLLGMLPPSLPHGAPFPKSWCIAGLSVIFAVVWLLLEESTWVKVPRVTFLSLSPQDASLSQVLTISRRQLSAGDSLRGPGIKETNVSPLLSICFLFHF